MQTEAKQGQNLLKTVPKVIEKSTENGKNKKRSQETEYRSQNKKVA